ncbi:MAG TPA: hypothetical protein DIU15_01350 [Deltaproteobacteria bacterium]|nr:hypothetical protein [Deltaproteobacteria bacterium]HCP44670.1 hypothetical protein [Deltaproteobacteria bacterium]
MTVNPDRVQWTLDSAHTSLREFWNTSATWFNASPGQRTPALVAHLLTGLEERKQRCQRVLDLACGAGRTTRAIHQELRPTSGTAGVDLSDVMIRAAREESSQTEALAVSFHEAPAQALPFHDESFDLAFCNLGLMIFPDTTAALREVRRVLQPEGLFRATVWGREEHTTLVTLMPRVASSLDIALERPARSNFHLGSSDALASAAVGTGFVLSEARPVALEFPFDNGSDACNQMGISMESPSPRLAGLAHAERQHLVDGCEKEADRLLDLSHGTLTMDLLIGEFRPCA